ncbi:methyl-accepting chemotaxis protein [Parahaliea aestuarii]|nr:PAS domain-containing methyl-accepting chemotaxis protein [Parahaliea aestuarii]
MFRKLGIPAKAGEIQALHKVQAIIEFEPDGTIVQANDNFLKVMGYDLGDIVGRHHSIFVDSAISATSQYRDFWKQLGTGQAQSGLYRRVANGGREVWIQGSYSPIMNRRGRPYRVIKHAMDVTSDRLNIADMEGRLKAIDRAQAVISFDLNGTILDANDNFLSALGYKREEVIGKHHRIFVDRAERESPAYRQFWDRLQSGEYHSGQFRRLRKNGDDIWIQATYNPIFDMAGRPFKIVKYATDITRQTRASQELQQSLGSLAETVPQIASKAQNANQLALDATQCADQGGAVVQTLVGTINQLNDRAKSMSDIISLIDSIALQTKLLALNAAVEAAQAGEQGRGFAIVAHEVRALAQRTADSSRDINELVKSTIDKLSESSGCARQAGDAMKTIVGSITEVTDRIRDIVDVADSQSRDVGEVTEAISRLQA